MPRIEILKPVVLRRSPSTPRPQPSAPAKGAKAETRGDLGRKLGAAKGKR